MAFAFKHPKERVVFIFTTSEIKFLDPLIIISTLICPTTPASFSNQVFLVGTTFLVQRVSFQFLSQIIADVNFVDYLKLFLRSQTYLCYWREKFLLQNAPSSMSLAIIIGST